MWLLEPVCCRCLPSTIRRTRCIGGYGETARAAITVGGRECTEVRAGLVGKLIADESEVIAHQ